MSTVPRLPRSSRRRWASVAAGTLAAFALISRTSAACSCGGDWTPADADVVFEGQAVEVHVPMHLEFVPSSPRGPAPLVWRLWASANSAFDEDVVTVFRVRRSWKATVPEFVSVNTGSGLCCNCTFGRVFDEGVDYVVYAATSGEGEYRVGACAGRAVAASALPGSELASLGKGVPPIAGRGGPSGLWRGVLLPAAMSAASGLVIGAWLLFRAWRRRRAELES